jgi:hypothetical protein
VIGLILVKRLTGGLKMGDETYYAATNAAEIGDYSRWNLTLPEWRKSELEVRNTGVILDVWDAEDNHAGRRLFMAPEKVAELLRDLKEGKGVAGETIDLLLQEGHAVGLSAGGA